ncbi:MAG: hypothetical protein B6242_08690 [Anaerolineaceae bacterium 4572_78]|nr:MAG: hypothetical protein B6242_08690 [Anaerolineaceae bacterium 4572_78]
MLVGVEFGRVDVAVGTDVKVAVGGMGILAGVVGMYVLVGISMETLPTLGVLVAVSIGMQLESLLGSGVKYIVKSPCAIITSVSSIIFR